MGIKFTEKKLRNYFKDKLLKKALAFVMLLFFNFNIFSEIIPDPASIGTKVSSRPGRLCARIPIEV